MGRFYTRYLTNSGFMCLLVSTKFDNGREPFERGRLGKNYFRVYSSSTCYGCLMIFFIYFSVGWSVESGVCSKRQFSVCLLVASILFIEVVHS